MIKYVKGNILESDAEALVNPVNCVGVMGTGLAKQFKAKYPEMFDKYKELCKKISWWSYPYISNQRQAAIYYKFCY